MKRNTLTTAVLAGLTGIAGMASVANAVNVNPDGLGQVLLFPYYTARGGNNTLISIVNTTERGKAVKIRFIEAINSREVLDFNIYMSPFDVWTTAILPTPEGGAKMLTTDTTCTVPYIFGDRNGEQEFLTFEFSGALANRDGGPTGVERTASGYIEVIEMGTMVEDTGFRVGAGGFLDRTDPRIIPWASKHVNGVPRNCDLLVDYWTVGFGLPWTTGNLGGANFGFDEAGASGGLFGSGSIVNVRQGTMVSYNATAVDGFWNRGTTRHTQPDSLLPNLSDGNNRESFVFNNGALERDVWVASLFALNATLTLDRLFNEYVTSDELEARTEWVLTFPTKRFHTDERLAGVTANNPIPPFTRTMHKIITAQGWVSTNLACEDMEFRFWDREEREPAPGVDRPIVSPPPPETARQQLQLCREANVVRFASNGAVPDASEIMAEPRTWAGAAGVVGPAASVGDRLGYTNLGLPYDAGWLRFDLGAVPDDSPVCAVGGVCDRLTAAPSDRGRLARGLPVIGFQATTIQNGQLASGVLSNYGASFNHRGSRVFTSVTAQ